MGGAGDGDGAGEGVGVGVTVEVKPGKELKAKVLLKTSELLPTAVLATMLLSWTLDVTGTEPIDEERRDGKEEV